MPLEMAAVAANAAVLTTPLTVGLDRVGTYHFRRSTSVIWLTPASEITPSHTKNSDRLALHPAANTYALPVGMVSVLAAVVVMVLPSTDHRRTPLLALF